VGSHAVGADITRPCLFDRRKFDLRFIIVVKSLEPFEAYVYNVFWIRFANIPFSLTKFDEYQRHFTVRPLSLFSLLFLLL